MIILFLLTFSLKAEENPLKDLAEKMKDVEWMLRDDRHDVFVQMRMKNIAGKLDAMIAEAEKAEQQQQQKQKQEQKQTQKQKRQQERQQLASGPNPNSQLGPATPQGPTQVSGTASKWAKLPPAARDELLQTYANEVPMRWRNRLEAYFLSIAAEETKDRR